jgi:2-haloacid dehalogenase
MSETNQSVGRPVSHIVFDIGKVLIHYDPDIPYSRLIPDAAERNAFFETVCTHEWNLEQDRGRSWTEAEALLIDRFPTRRSLSAPSVCTGTRWSAMPMTTVSTSCST